MTTQSCITPVVRSPLWVRKKEPLTPWNVLSAPVSREEIGSHRILTGNDCVTLHGFRGWFSGWLAGSESLNKCRKRKPSPDFSDEGLVNLSITVTSYSMR